MSSVASSALSSASLHRETDAADAADDRMHTSIISPPTTTPDEPERETVTYESHELLEELHRKGVHVTMKKGDYLNLIPRKPFSRHNL